MTNTVSLEDKHGLRFSFVIPALNESVMLSRLLESIKQLEVSPNSCVHEILVIDAESTDNTVSIAKSFGCKVLTAKPGIVSKSRNIGAQQAEGDVLAFIDADCELPSDWLKKASDELMQPTVIGAGFKMAANSESSAWVEQTWYELAHRETASETSSEVDWLATFNLVVKKEAFESAGGFDENLQTCEDVELGYRLSKLGKLRKITSSGVIHHGESNNSRIFKREAWRARGSWGILKKHWSDPRELLSFLLPIVLVLSTAVSIILTLIAIALPQDANSHIILFAAAFIISPLPILLLVLRRKARLSMLPKCMILLYVYFLARFQGIFKPFPRVER